MIRWLVSVLVTMAAVAGPALPQTAPPGDNPAIIVGTLRLPPFAMRNDDGDWYGLAADLWHAVAADAAITFVFRDFDYDLRGLMLALERGEIDVAVAHLRVTPEAETRVDFSHPYMTDGLGMLVRQEPAPSVLGTLAALPWARILGAISAMLSAILVVGLLIWLAERRGNPHHYGTQMADGVGNGMWWAIVTMTTVGYGDKVPITPMGRVVGALWMLISLFSVAAFSATLASSFVISQLQTGITGPEGLPRSRVAVVAGTSGADWAGQQRLTITQYDFVIQATKAVQRGEADVLIHERAILGYLVAENGWTDLALLPQTLSINDYALAFSPGNAILREQVNRSILRVTQSPIWDALVSQYLGRSSQ